MTALATFEPPDVPGNTREPCNRRPMLPASVSQNHTTQTLSDLGLYCSSS